MQVHPHKPMEIDRSPYTHPIPIPIPIGIRIEIPIPTAALDIFHRYAQSSCRQLKIERFLTMPTRVLRAEVSERMEI